MIFSKFSEVNIQINNNKIEHSLCHRSKWHGQLCSIFAKVSRQQVGGVGWVSRIHTNTYAAWTAGSRKILLALHTDMGEKEKDGCREHEWVVVRIVNTCPSSQSSVANGLVLVWMCLLRCVHRPTRDHHPSVYGKAKRRLGRSRRWFGSTVL